MGIKKNNSSANNNAGNCIHFPIVIVFGFSNQIE
jgi:hypothetical protein